MSISVQAWMDRLRQRVQEGSIVVNPVSGSDFFRSLYMNAYPPPARQWDEPEVSLSIRAPIDPLGFYRIELDGTDRFVEIDSELILYPRFDRIAFVRIVAQRLADHRLTPDQVTEETRRATWLLEDSIARTLLNTLNRHLPGPTWFMVDEASEVTPEQWQRMLSMSRPSPSRHLWEMNPPAPLPSCAQCGKTGLKQTYTSTRDQREICADCFEGLQDKGLAREQGQPLKKKARHPLDAWMEGAD